MGKYFKEEVYERFSTSDIISILEEVFDVKLENEVITSDDEKKYGFSKEDTGVFKYVDKDKKVICFLGEDRVSSWYFLFLRYNDKNYLLSGDNKEDLLSDLKEFETIINSSVGEKESDNLDNEENDNLNKEDDNSDGLVGASGFIKSEKFSLDVFKGKYFYESTTPSDVGAFVNDSLARVKPKYYNRKFRRIDRGYFDEFIENKRKRIGGRR